MTVQTGPQLEEISWIAAVMTNGTRASAEELCPPGHDCEFKPEGRIGGRK